MTKPKMNSKNLRWLLLGLLGLSVVLFFAVSYLGLMVLGSESKHMVDLKVQSQTAESQLSDLQQAKKDVEQYSYFKQVASTVIPNDKDQAETILEINQIAEAAGIQLQSITFPASNLGISSSQDATSSSSTSSAISQAKPVSGIAGLYSLQLTITPDTSNTVPASKQVTYAKMIDFLNRIENNRHTAQITNFNILPASNNQSLSFNLTINIFIRPQK